MTVNYENILDKLCDDVLLVADVIDNYGVRAERPPSPETLSEWADKLRRLVIDVDTAIDRGTE